MSVRHIYFFPGLGASSKIFEFIRLPENYQLHYLEWKMPESVTESLASYAARMCLEVKHTDPILIGVSFGGILVQEMAKHIPTHKVVIVSSIKSHQELPTRLRLVRDTKAYKLFPTKIVENIEDYTKYFFGDFLKKRAELYKMYLSVRDKNYLQWAIYHVLHWKQENPPENLVHIHGLEDNVFPVKYLRNFIPVHRGTHVMILNKAKTISGIIQDNI